MNHPTTSFDQNIFSFPTVICLEPQNPSCTTLYTDVYSNPLYGPDAIQVRWYGFSANEANTFEPAEVHKRVHRVNTHYDVGRANRHDTMSCYKL